MRFKKNMKKLISFSLVGAMVLEIFIGNPVNIKAASETSTVDFPNVYPSDKLEKISDAAIKVKVDALIKTMTQDEMYGMLIFSPPSSNAKGYGAGYINGVPRLGVPVIRSWDGPKGVISNDDLETTSPSSELALASSFSEDLAYKYGQLTGSENKATAGNMQLSPQLDLARSPFFMRTRDTLGEDPYLTGVLGTKLSAGVESENAMATLKHMSVYISMFHHPYLAEYSTLLGFQPMPPQDDSIVNEQALHEMYLAPYEKIVKDGNSSAIMSSYNKINGVPAAANSYLLKDVLRNMWGFKGLTITDWSSSLDINDVFIAKGTDIEANIDANSSANNRSKIEAAIAAGKMTFDDVVSATMHTLTAMGRVGYLGLVVVNQDGTVASDPNPPAAIELSTLEGLERTALLQKNDEVALESAIKGAVLLKNNNNVLPLSENDSIAMIGLTGQYTLSGHYAESAFGWLQGMASPYENMVNILGKDKITAAVGMDIVGQKIPENLLFLGDGTQLSDINGVKETVTSTVYKIIPNMELTTGTINGNVNRTYKNSADGTALTKGTTVTLTTYLKAPETGGYELNLSGIGGTINANITVDGVNKTIPFSAVGVLGVQSANNAWPTGNLVPTVEGMNISTQTQSVELVKDNRYKIVITANANTNSKDQQLRLTWFKPGQREEDLNDAVEAAANNKKVVVFMHELGKGDIPANSILPLQRSTLDLDTQQLDLLNRVITAAKSKGNQVIVVTNTALPITMNWINDVDAVLNMWLPGQQGGKATAQLLTGVANPSGKLPMTYPKNENDTQFGSIKNSYQNPVEVNEINEGIFSGYRWYEKQGISPLFAFGHGLSYTTFAYSNPRVTKTADVDFGYDVTFTIKNTGSVVGSEVAQVYLGEATVPSDIQMAKKQLVGFVRIEDLQPGESRTVNVKIERQSLSYWDEDSDLQTREDGTKDKYVVALGSRNILVGSALDDIRLSQKISVGGQEPLKPNVTVTSTTNTITLVWDKVDGEAYTVEQKAGGVYNNINATYTEESGRIKAIISGLNKATSYTFRVAVAVEDVTTMSNDLEVKTLDNDYSTGYIGGSNNGPNSGAIIKEPVQATAGNTQTAKSKLSVKFIDAASIPSWAQVAIADLVNKNIISGRPNGSFDPQGQITRAEMVKLVVTGLDFKDSGNAKEFNDVKEGIWYKPLIDIATSNGIVYGVGNRMFKPNSNISRQDICVMIYNALKAMNVQMPQEEQSSFGDDLEISSYAREAVYKLRAYSIINGRTDSSFDPTGSATRAEASVIIKGVLDYIAESKS